MDLSSTGWCARRFSPTPATAAPLSSRGTALQARQRLLALRPGLTTDLPARRCLLVFRLPSPRSRSGFSASARAPDPKQPRPLARS